MLYSFKSKYYRYIFSPYTLEHTPKVIIQKEETKTSSLLLKLLPDETKLVDDFNKARERQNKYKQIAEYREELLQIAVKLSIKIDLLFETTKNALKKKDSESFAKTACHQHHQSNDDETNVLKKKLSLLKAAKRVLNI